MIVNAILIVILYIPSDCIRVKLIVFTRDKIMLDTLY